MIPIPIPDEAAARRPYCVAITVGPPAGVSDEDCGTVRMLREPHRPDQPVGPAHYAYFRPTPAELSVLMGGGFLELALWGSPAPRPAMPSFSHSDSCDRYYADEADLTIACTCGATEAQAWLDELVAERDRLVRESSSGVIAAGVAASLEHEAQSVYDRQVLVEVLVYHWRDDIKGCGCGWAVLGASHPEHVADVYEDSVGARLPGRCKPPENE